MTRYDHEHKTTTVLRKRPVVAQVRSGGLERGATNQGSHRSRGADPQALENLEIAVRAAGGTRTDIVILALVDRGRTHPQRPIGARSFTRLLPSREFAEQHLDRGFRPSQQRWQCQPSQAVFNHANGLDQLDLTLQGCCFILDSVVLSE